ncbi:hypothetical protein HDU88_006174 [Geranomyces variabilis]|nr:hypothetical protein HDU88_006174 [Geranomyces variabilis]
MLGPQQHTLGGSPAPVQEAATARIAYPTLPTRSSSNNLPLKSGSPMSLKDATVMFGGILKPPDFIGPEHATLESGFPQQLVVHNQVALNHPYAQQAPPRQQSFRPRQFYPHVDDQEHRQFAYSSASRPARAGAPATFEVNAPLQPQSQLQRYQPSLHQPHQHTSYQLPADASIQQHRQRSHYYERVDLPLYQSPTNYLHQGHFQYMGPSPMDQTAFPLQPMNYINIANPSPSFAHFAANITQMPNQQYYQPVMYHQMQMPTHPLKFVASAPSKSHILLHQPAGAPGSDYATSMNGDMQPPASVPMGHQLHMHTKEWFDRALSLAHEKYNHGEYAVAYQMLLTVHQYDATHFPTLLLLGCTCYSLNMYELSIHYNNLILQIDPKFAEAYSNLGTTYRAMAQNSHALIASGGQGNGSSAYNLNMAEQYYRIAISIRPQYWDASINLAGLLTAIGRPQEAVAVYDSYEAAMESVWPNDLRLDRVAVTALRDVDVVLIMTQMEASRSKKIMQAKAAGKRYPGETNGWTAGRRRDLYYAKASLVYGMHNLERARLEYIKGLISIGLDLSETFVQAASGVFTAPVVTPQQAMVALEQQTSTSAGLLGKPELNATASGMLQTLAKIYQDLSQTALAISLYYIALSIWPNANTCNNIGILLAGHRLDEALAWYDFGLKLEPSHVHLLTNLGSALKDRGQVGDGIGCYVRAISIQPDFFIALANLANVYKDLGRVEEAIDLYRRALEVKPDFVEAFCNYVNSLLFVCQWDARKENLKRINNIVESQLRDGIGGSGDVSGRPRTVPTVLPFHTFTYAGLSAWQVREICRRNGERVLYNVKVTDWFPGFSPRPITLMRQLAAKGASRILPNYQHERALRYPYPFPLPKKPSPLIHIGYLSSDFNNHPLAHLMQSVFGLHDRSRFRVYCYSLSPSDSSPYRAKIESGSDVFVDVHAWSVQQIVERVVADGIHVLCNLNGYTKGGRNEVFAARPAPVQMQFMGFAGSMGSGEVWDPENNPDECRTAESGLNSALINSIPSTATRLGDSLKRMDAVPHTWLDYLVTDEIATPRLFVCGEPLAFNEQPYDAVTDAMRPQPVDRGLVRVCDDANRVFTEAMVYMPSSYFVNDHRIGFREPVDPVIDEVCAALPVEPYGLLEDGDLSPSDLRLWRGEQLRRLKMRRDMFPWMREDTVVYANFNQLYKVDPEIFKTWLRILARVPNSILWLLRFPPAGESRLLSLAHSLHGPHVASRVIFTDVAGKDVHIHRGRIADVFLDTPECNAHTTAADILWSGTPVVTYPRYDFKMCSRVCTSIAYAAGRWEKSDLVGLDPEVVRAGRRGLTLDDVERLKDPMLLGHWMVVKSYQEFEDVASNFGNQLRWDWLELRRPNVVAKTQPPPPYGAVHSFQNVIDLTSSPAAPATPLPTKAPSPFHHSPPPHSGVTTAHVSEHAETTGTEAGPLTHIYTPISATLPTRLRRRLFLNRDSCALFDTPQWVRALERAAEKALERWEQDYAAVRERNARELQQGPQAASLDHAEPAMKMYAQSRCLWVRGEEISAGQVTPASVARPRVFEGDRAQSPGSSMLSATSS